MPAIKKQARPAPPEDLDGEALLEWHRICDELDAAGRLDKTDRALLTVYVEQWSVNRAAMRSVARHGAVIRLNNKVIAQSPFYKVARETAVILRGLLADLCLTPASRGTTQGEADDDLEI